MNVPYVEWIECDLTRRVGLERLLDGVDVIVHSAGLAHQVRGVPVESFAAMNAEVTRRVAEAAVLMGVRQLVLVSSASIYGLQPGVRDESTPCAPDTSYGQSKLAGEREAIAAFEGSSAKLAVLRLVTLYGAGDPGNVARLMTAIDRHRFLWVGRGTNHKSLLHVSDAARAVLLAIGKQHGTVGVFNVNGTTVLMREVVSELAHHLGRRILPFHIPAWLGLGVVGIAGMAVPTQHFHHIRLTLSKWLNDDAYDGSRFENAFGFRARVQLSDGLREEVEWYRHHQLSR